jgi:hypothetical protein
MAFCFGFCLFFFPPALQTFRPEHNWRDINCRNAHLVHQNWCRISFTLTVFGCFFSPTIHYFRKGFEDKNKKDFELFGMQSSVNLTYSSAVLCLWSGPSICPVFLQSIHVNCTLNFILNLLFVTFVNFMKFPWYSYFLLKSHVDVKFWFKEIPVSFFHISMTCIFGRLDWGF